MATDETATGPGPDDCFACRATGAVISNLGGAPQSQPCPWCEGSGVRLPGHDAQARWRALQGGSDADAGVQAA